MNREQAYFIYHLRKSSRMASEMRRAALNGKLSIRKRVWWFWWREVKAEEFRTMSMEDMASRYQLRFNSKQVKSLWGPGEFSQDIKIKEGA